MDNSKCVVLVPFIDIIEPECERGLAALEARGYVVRRAPGYAAIDQGRSQMATDALADGFEELMWIDSDMGFDADSVDSLRKHKLPFVSGIYAKKGMRALSCCLMPETREVIFGKGGGLIEIKYAAAGFMLTHRNVYTTIAKRMRLPECNKRFGHITVPYFLPMIVREEKGGHWYLGEDFSFCERARICGFSIMADTTIRLDHIGKHSYSWEDAGTDRLRYETYNFHVT